MTWDTESLWQKAKLYTVRAHGEDRNGDLYPLWSTLALEFLARAALAHVHPALLADHRHPENIMYAFGYSGTGKSVPAETVFRRCQKVIPNFTEAEARQCMALIDRRNEELHTGAPSFSQFPTRLWLADYYRNCKLLCDFLGKELADLLGVEEAKGAQLMIDSLQERVSELVREAMRDAARFYEGLDPDRRKTRGDDIEHELRTRFILTRKTVPCPACGCIAFLTGEVVGEGPPKPSEEDLVQEVVVLPTHLECLGCELKLNTHAEVHAAGFGGQYTVEEHYDPVDFFNIQIDELHEYGDYLNE